MKKLFVVILAVALASGCATCQTTTERQAADVSDKTPFWQRCVGCLFDCVAESALEYGTYQQRIQSGDPTR